MDKIEKLALYFNNTASGTLLGAATALNVVNGQYLIAGVSGVAALLNYVGGTDRLMTLNEQVQKINEEQKPQI